MSKTYIKLAICAIFVLIMMIIVKNKMQGSTSLTQVIDPPSSKKEMKTRQIIDSIAEKITAFIPSKTNLQSQKIDWNAIKLRTPPSADKMHDKWIVITTINPPTSDVKKLAAIPGWKVVIVGDTKSPKDWSYPNCIHLFVEDQLKLNYKVTDLIKFRSYARKNIGFLYAVQHGAKIIYETDDDNSPTKKEIGFDQSRQSTYLRYEPEPTNHVMNPYAHFGQSSIWPRGYPLDKIAVRNTFKYRQCPGKSAYVQQGVVDGDPDVDAIYRLTRKNANKDLVVYFDKTAKPLMLPRGIMSPYNSQNTLHMYDAFWGLLLPQTVAFRVCDIWRSYWAQRLLWELGGSLTFFPPNAFTYRNAHSYLDDFIDERELYHLSAKLTKFLVEWKPTTTHFFDKVVELSIAMVKKGFWKWDDVELVKLWLTDLISVGYKVPKPSIQEACKSKVETILPEEQKTSNLDFANKSKRKKSPKLDSAAKSKNLNSSKVNSAAVQKEQKSQALNSTAKSKEQKPATLNAAATKKEQKSQTLNSTAKSKEQKPATLNAAATKKEQKSQTLNSTAKSKEQKSATLNAAATKKEEKSPVLNSTAKSKEQKSPNLNSASAQKEQKSPNLNSAAAQKEQKSPNLNATAAQKEQKSPNLNSAAAQKEQKSPNLNSAAAQKEQKSPNLNSAAAQKEQKSPNLNATAAQKEQKSPNLNSAAAQKQQKSPKHSSAAAQKIEIAKS